MAEQNPKQNTSQSYDFMREITQGWDALSEQSTLELRCLFPKRTPNVSRYSPDESGFEMAIEHAAAMNKAGMNVYPIINPVRASAPLRRDGRQSGALDTDILASFFFWADADEEEATQAINNFAGPKCTMSVKTGTVPFVRPHIYWRIQDGPMTDLEAWSRIQKGIAARLKTDSSVTNPARIMRLPGMINWPTPEKMQKRGRVPELATFRTQYKDNRDPVSVEQMTRLFDGFAPAKKEFDIDADPEHKSVSDYSDILARAKTDGQKHTGVRDLAASLAGQGVARPLAEAIIREASPVWDNNVEDLISSAYEKFFSERPTIEPSADAVEKDSSGVITGLKIKSSDQFLDGLKPLEYVVEDIIPTGVVYSMTGYPGHGKTTLAIQIALAVASGEPFAERITAAGDVLFLAGENPYNLKWQYAAALAAKGVSSQDRMHFIEGHFSISAMVETLKEQMQKLPNLKLVIIDSLQAFFEGDDDNANIKMVEAARQFREVGDIDSMPAVLVIAHPAGKEPRKDNLVPRGGGAFLAEIDGNLTVWGHGEEMQTLHHSPKFRGAGFEPIDFVMASHQFDHLTDSHGVPLRLRVSRQAMLIEQANKSQRHESNLKKMLELIDGDSRMTEREMAQSIGLPKTSLRRLRKEAVEEKLIKRHARSWQLTKGGEDYLNNE